MRYTSSGERVLPSVERNAERESGLRDFNLLEYTRHIRIEKMPTNPELSDKTFYYFNINHPLRFTHVQVLDPKHKVVILTGRVPEIESSSNERAHQSSLDKYGRYMGTLLCPWDTDGFCGVET